MNRNAVNFKAVANYIRNKHPDIAASYVQRADSALAGMHILPGTGGKPYFVGDPPKWYMSPVNDNEYVWLLNRMAHWKTLLQAYILTENKPYADKVISELLNWIDVCKRPKISLKPEDIHVNFNSATPWRSLEVGIRMYSIWVWVIGFLSQTELMNTELLEKISASAYEHGEVLRNVCPVLWPNADHNHYFMEMLGLLSVAMTFRGFKTADEWGTYAIHELERCVDAQITDDGGQIEGCPHYHNLCVSLIFQSVYMSEKYGFAFSDNYIRKAKKTIDYSLYAQRPSGTIVPWGDSDADDSSVRSAVCGYLIWNDKSWLNILLNQGMQEKARAVLHDYLWDVPCVDKLLEDTEFFSGSSSVSFPAVNWQRELKQAAMRTGWDKDDLSVFFACRTPVNNGHAHIDPMGFDFTAYGKPLLVDPGRYTYREDDDRKNFKSAHWHNTLTINGQEPFQYINSWNFSSQKHGDITNVHESPGIIAAEAIHYNYEPIIHKRLIAIIDSKYLLVLDRLDNMNKTDFADIHFHIDSVTTVINNECHFAETNDCGVNIRIIFSSDFQPSLNEGKMSDSLDIYRESAILSLRDNGNASTRAYTALCIPYVGSFQFLDAESAQVSIEGDKLICKIFDKQFVWTSNSFYLRESMV